MSNFLKKVISHHEVKTGAAHLLVGLLIGVVATAIFKADVA